MRITLQSAPGTTYRVESSADLITWTVVGTLVVDANGNSTFTDTGSGGLPRRFYRVIKLP
jgi:hypothetical protein